MLRDALALRELLSVTLAVSVCVPIASPPSGNVGPVPTRPLRLEVHWIEALSAPSWKSDATAVALMAWPTSTRMAAAVGEVMLRIGASLGSTSGRLTALRL